MSEQVSNTVGQILTGLEAALPDPVRTGLFAATSRMLGGLAAHPAAWFRRSVQGFEDTTNARTLVSTGLAAALVDKLKDDPVVMQAAAEAYMPSILRKVTNRAAVMTVTVEETSQSTDSGAKASEPNDDWMNTFMRFAEDASSERLQSLFGKILAGEIINPGSFAPSTLRAVSELTQEVASDFEWAWSRNFQYAMFKTTDFQKGASWTKLEQLREAGLVAPNDAVIFQPDFEPRQNGLSPWMLGTQSHGLTIQMSKAGSARIPMLPFTRVGNEIGKLLPPPDWRANLRVVAAAMPKAGVASIHLFSTSAPAEVLWTAPVGGLHVD